MSVMTAIILGAVQGTHGVPARVELGPSRDRTALHPDFEQPGVLFDVVLHLGTLGAVLVYFWREVMLVLSGLKPGADGAHGRRLMTLLVLATIPAVVAALLFKDAIEASFENLLVVGVSLCATGTWLFLASRSADRRAQTPEISRRATLS